jgi:hypothetical protein
MTVESVQITALPEAQDEEFVWTWSDGSEVELPGTYFENEWPGEEIAQVGTWSEGFLISAASVSLHSLGNANWLIVSRNDSGTDLTAHRSEDRASVVEIWLEAAGQLDQVGEASALPVALVAGILPIGSDDIDLAVFADQPSDVPPQWTEVYASSFMSEDLLRDPAIRELMRGRVTWIDGVSAGDEEAKARWGARLAAWDAL